MCVGGRWGGREVSGINYLTLAGRPILSVTWPLVSRLLMDVGEFGAAWKREGRTGVR